MEIGERRVRVASASLVHGIASLRFWWARGKDRDDPSTMAVAMTIQIKVAPPF